MTENERDIVQAVIENEGFDYAFFGYTSFKKTLYSDRYVIEDAEFHRLREAYLAARKALAEYVGTNE